MKIGTAFQCVRNGIVSGVSIGWPRRCIKYKGYSRVLRIEWMQSDGMGCFGCVGTKSPSIDDARRHALVGTRRYY